MFFPLAILLLAGTSFANPTYQVVKLACPEVHVFGARGTTAPPGYGIGQSLVSAILQAHPGTTAEPINYPACGGGASCGGVSYAQSVQQGTAAVVRQVKAFAQQCPKTSLVLIGDSQGSQVFDTALCGQGSLSAFNIKAAIFMGNPRFRAGDSYNVGTCKLHGFAARPAGQQCGSFNSRLQSYCDAADPYCCRGNDGQVHQGYAKQHASAMLQFINSRLAN